MQNVGEAVFDIVCMVLVFLGGIRLLVRTRAGSPYRLLGLAFVLMVLFANRGGVAQSPVQSCALDAAGQDVVRA